VASVQEVARADLPFEFMLNSLRLLEGFSLSDFTARTGLPRSALQAGLEQASAKGLLAREGDRVWPTELGLDFLSDLQSLFLPD
jgi:oxygen-independent coproporphyrinogen-3 oxidase